MNFNISNIHTIYESDDSLTNLNSIEKISNNLKDFEDGKESIQNFYNNICPISGEVFNTMKNNAADPNNLKIAVTKNENEINLFIEAVEFMTYCEAAEKTIKEAADTIINSIEDKIPGVGVEDINIVFPNDALNKGVIGSENRGIATRNDWAMQLMRGCCRYGLKPRIGIENDK